jgi:hypothetical protein
MGQKVGGYRRNVPYGQESLLLGNVGASQRKTKKVGWIFDVNPKGVVGWNRGTSGTKERDYGKELSHSRRLRKELEEVRRAFGCESNGLGRKGTGQTGYVVYGEYTGVREGSGRKDQGESDQGVQEKSGKAFRLMGKGSREGLSKVDLLVARERVAIQYEKKRKIKVDRQRTNLKERRKEKGLEGEKEERKSVLGVSSSKRVKGEERCEAVALSGVVPITKRRTNLIVRELEAGLNHMEVLRTREGLRRHHAKSSQTGRKRLGEVERETRRLQGGYYGFHVAVKGPLEGARRTMAYVIQLGTVPRGTKRARRRTTHEHAKTKVGTVGVRVTYCYGRG